MSVAPEVFEQLVDQCQGLVRSLAVAVHRNLPPRVDLDDLIAYGQVGLVEAARTFDPARGSRFSTFAYYRVRGAIYDGVAKMSWFGRTAPGQIQCGRPASDVLRGEAETERRSASERLLPAADGADGELRQRRPVPRARAVVQFATRRDSDLGRDAAEPADESALAGPTVAIQREIYGKLHELIDGLPEQAAALIRATYFEGLTLQDAGQRLGMSKSWASRLHAKALQLLAESLRVQGVCQA